MIHSTRQPCLYSTPSSSRSAFRLSKSVPSILNSGRRTLKNTSSEPATGVLTECRAVALDIITSICRRVGISKESNLVKVLRHISECFLTGVIPGTQEPADTVLKEALLQVLTHLSVFVKKGKNLQNHIEMLLPNMLFCFESENAFLRGRICDVVKAFSFVQFKTQGLVQLILKGVTTCLFDKELPVRTKAAAALGHLLHQDQAFALLQPNLKNILQQYLFIMNEIEDDEVFHSLQRIILSFKDDMGQDAEILIQELVRIFSRHVQTVQDEEETLSKTKSELSASACLSAIKTIIKSNIAPANLERIETTLVPFLNYAFTEEGSNYIEEGLEILQILLYKSETVTPTIRSYFPVLTYIVAGNAVLDKKLEGITPEVQVQTSANIKLVDYKFGWGQEFLPKMYGCLQNYIIMRDGSFLLSKDDNNLTFISLLFRMITRVVEKGLSASTIPGAGDEDEVNMVCVIYLLGELLKSYPERLTADTLSGIVEFLMRSLQHTGGGPHFKGACIEAIALGFYNDASAALAKLGDQGLREYLDIWYANRGLIKREHSKKNILLGFTSIFRVGADTLPVPIVLVLDKLMKNMVKLCAEIMQMRSEMFGGEMDPLLEKAIESYNEATPQIDEDQRRVQELIELRDFAFLDECDNEYMISSPIDLVDEILHFKNRIKFIDQKEAVLSKRIQEGLNEDEVKLLEYIIGKAQVLNQAIQISGQQP
eukprot:TRINITY_DN3787_c0_g1_i8.p1 TRINITY_DN3787_c0_g1~~TRINITY_DN3787_c0_g1_i8.p1  ORF type:complete len:712 (+),score=159.60 TRINITY_DN3787_c0_g1_i8:596-2731(+)